MIFRDQVTIMTTAKIFSDEQHHFIGNDLSGVVFVRDYIQLQFNPPPIVNALTPVTVVAGKKSATQGETEFANLLIAQIDKVVSDFEIIPESHLCFRFEEGSEI